MAAAGEPSGVHASAMLQMRQPGPWIEPQGLRETIGRSLELALRQMDQSKIVMRVRAIWLKPQARY